MEKATGTSGPRSGGSAHATKMNIPVPARTTIKHITSIPGEMLNCGLVIPTLVVEESHGPSFTANVLRFWIRLDTVAYRGQYVLEGGVVEERASRICDAAPRRMNMHVLKTR
jgi:hypothetical protein